METNFVTIIESALNMASKAGVFNLEDATVVNKALKELKDKHGSKESPVEYAEVEEVK